MNTGKMMHRRRVSEESGSSSSSGNRSTMSNNRRSLLPPDVATTVRMNEQEQARMRTAYALIDEARDMEQETLAHQHQHGHAKNEENSSYQHHLYQKQQQRTRIELYQEALAIMESLVGVYHPDVANTYHLFGWSFLLYNDNDTNERRYHHPEQSATTSAHIISALIYFLKALRITHRLFGKDHPSTCVLLDDIRDVVRGSTSCSNDDDDDDDGTHPTSSSSSSTTRRRLLETQCTQILDSWHYQNLAEAAIVVHQDAVAALHWYHCALNLLPTTSIAEPSINSAHNSENSNNRRPEISTVVVVIDDDDPTDTKEEGTTSLLSSNEDTECSNNRHDGSEWTTSSLDDDDDAMTIGVEDYNYHYDTSGTGIGLADLERATIQFQMARLLSQQPPEHPLPSPLIENHHNDGQYGLSLSSFDLYCRALAVLPLWLSEQNQMVIQARHDIASYSI